MNLETRERRRRARRQLRWRGHKLAARGVHHVHRYLPNLFMVHGLLSREHGRCKRVKRGDRRFVDWVCAAHQSASSRIARFTTSTDISHTCGRSGVVGVSEWWCATKNCKTAFARMERISHTCQGSTSHTCYEYKHPNKSSLALLSGVDDCHR